MSSDHEELFVIATLGRPVAGLPVGIGDDGAVLADGTVLTTDTMIEGVHWDHRLSPADVGWKLVAVNVSDLAAMGARPRWALLNMSLPAPLDRAWVTAFAEGLHAALDAHGLPLVGGDTTRSPVRALSLSVGGHAERPCRRDGGRAGDLLYVTGPLGRSAEAFLSPDPSPEALAWLRRPRPPLAFALAAAPLVSAMMDLSDGLTLDLARLCAASGVGATVRSKDVPGVAPLSWRLSFGEDYELLLAVPPEDAARIEAVAAKFPVSLTRIGELSESGVLLDGAPAWPPPLFAHFSEPPSSDPPAAGTAVTSECR